MALLISRFLNGIFVGEKPFFGRGRHKMKLTAKPTEESWAVAGEGLGKITADSFPAAIALENTRFID